LIFHKRAEASVFNLAQRQEADFAYGFPAVPILKGSSNKSRQSGLPRLSGYETAVDERMHHLHGEIMPATTFSESILVNRGLAARSILDGAAEASATAGDAATADIVVSFKKLASEAAEPNLVAIFATFNSPLEIATFCINAKYTEMGGSEGVLGTPVSVVAATAGTEGYGREFRNGVICWHPQVGAHALHGPVCVRWDELGGPRGFLGFPDTDIVPGNDIRAEGVFAHFQGGSIYWAPLPLINQAGLGLANGAVRAAINAGPAAASGNGAAAITAASASTAAVAARGLIDGAPGGRPAFDGAAAVTGSDTEVLVVGSVRIRGSSAGAFEVHGAIREKYLALGAEASILGYPRGDESGTPDGRGRFNQFQGGAIYWTPDTGAHEVHGLVRELWASGGAERNPQLGYPLSDEFIPDARVGHRRPEVSKKPILALPADVIKLPAEAAAAGFPASVVNVAPAAPRSAVAAAGALSGLAAAQAVNRASQAVVAGAGRPMLDHGAAAGVLERETGALAVLALSPASTPAATRSVNRFADFESGVLFWLRGSTRAITLAPLARTSDGTTLSFSGADIAAIAAARVGRAAFEQPNAQMTSVTFAGTTGYTHDGAQVHNRRHRVQVILLGTETQSLGPISLSVPVTATVELLVEVWFDPSRRQIALTPAGWTLIQASSGSYGAAIAAGLHARLDPLMWSSYELLTLPDTDAGAPIAVLSVKTLANGAVAVFVEPHPSLVLTNISAIAAAVPPGVLNLVSPT
jgi:hypothetical protein